ncbi:MAG: tetratricopeptide (TPR) repeat protein [Planctomycetota bacterium]|jgi:tetratricopeptide (TPR) repeat protein
MSRFSGGDLLEVEPVKINALATEPESNSFADDSLDLMIAELALNRGNTVLAVEHYLKLAKSQNNPDIAERAVRIAVYGQDLDSAAQAAQRWIELEPDRIEAQQVVAVIYIRQNRVDDAYAYLFSITQTSALDDEQLFSPLLGILMREKNTDAVMKISKRLADQYSDRAYALHMHGMLAAHNDRSEEALNYLDRAAAMEDIDGLHAARSRLLLKLGRSDEAIVSLQKALAANPDDQKLRMTYARLLVDAKQYEEARAEFEKLYLAGPDDVELLYTLGLLSLESNRLDDAEKYMLGLIERDAREGEAEYYLGRINESREQADAAIDWYRQVHVGDYKFEASLRIADLLAGSGRHDEAIKHLDDMLKGSQSDASLVRIYLAKGGLLRDATQYQRAIEVYNTALGIVPGNVDLLYARALVAEKLGRIDILESDIKVILDADPNNAHALNALGFTLADQTNRYEEALAYIERAIDIMPEDAAIIDSYGWVNYKLGRMGEAIRLLRKALSNYDDSEIAAHLGEVLWVNGDQNEARTVWQKALEKWPGNPLLQKVMQRFIP